MRLFHFQRQLLKFRLGKLLAPLHPISLHPILMAYLIGFSSFLWLRPLLLHPLLRSPLFHRHEKFHQQEKLSRQCSFSQ